MEKAVLNDVDIGFAVAPVSLVTSDVDERRPSSIGSNAMQTMLQSGSNPSLNSRYVLSLLKGIQTEISALSVAKQNDLTQVIEILEHSASSPLDKKQTPSGAAENKDDLQLQEGLASQYTSRRDSDNDKPSNGEAAISFTNYILKLRKDMKEKSDAQRQNMKLNQSPVTQDGFSVGAASREFEIKFRDLSVSNRKSIAHVQSLSIRSPVVEIMGNILDWNQFDIFALDSACEGRVLSTMVLHIFDRLNLYDVCKMNKSTLLNFIVQVEDGYNKVPYHNNVHAADVVHNVFWLLHSEQLRAGVMPLDVLAAILAAAVHDFKHPGTNNAFATKTQSDLAMRYNDISVLENMHISEAMLLAKRTCLWEGVDPCDEKSIRDAMVAMVLATDMTKHAGLVAEFKSSGPFNVAVPV
jgi:hypothetical protein